MTGLPVGFSWQLVTTTHDSIRTIAVLSDASFHYFILTESSQLMFLTIGDLANSTSRFHGIHSQCTVYFRI